MDHPGIETIKRAAEIVRSRREQLGLSQDMTGIGGPSRWIVTQLELDNQWPKRRATRMKIARALQWSEDSLELLAQGKDPVIEVRQTDSSKELKRLVAEARRILEEVERKLGQ